MKILLIPIMLSSLILSVQAQVVGVAPYQEDRVTLSPFVNGVAKMVRNGKTFYLNDQGQLFGAIVGEFDRFGDPKTIEFYESELEKYPELLPRTVMLYEGEQGVGVASPKGEVLLEAVYEHVDVKSTSFWKLKKDGKISLYLSDKTMLPFFEDIGYLDGEYFDVKEKGKWHLYSKTQQSIITENSYDGFDYCGGCSSPSPYVYAQKDGKWGIIDLDENILVPFSYEHVHARMRNDNWVASFSKEGVPVIVHIPTQKEFFDAEVVMGILLLRSDDKYGAIGPDGEFLLPFEYDHIEVPNKNSYLGYFGKYLIISKGGRKGVVNLDGVTVVRPDYDEIMVYDDYFVGERNNTAYLLKENDDLVLEAQHAEISHINEYFYSSGGGGLSIFSVKKRGYYGLYFAETDTYVEPSFYTVYVAHPELQKQSAYKTVQTDKNGLVSVFDLRGNLLLEDCYNVTYSERLGDRFILFNKNDRIGVFDLEQQKEVIPPSYTNFDFISIGDEIMIQANVFSETSDPYTGPHTFHHLYNREGKKLIDRDVEQLNGISTEDFLVKIKDEGYALWNFGTLSLQKLPYKTVYTLDSSHLLLVSNGAEKGKLYNLRMGKELAGTYSSAWLEKGYLPESLGDDYTLFRFKEGMALIYNKHGYGYINESGKVVLKPQYDWAFDFVGDVAMVCDSEDGDRNAFYFKMGYVDRVGKLVFPLEYDLSNPDLNHAESFIKGETVVLTKRQGTDYLYGLGEAKSGKILLPVQYRQMRTLAEGKWFLLEENRKFGIADQQGNIVVPVEQGDILFTTANYYNWKSETADIFPLLVSQDGKWRYLREDGTYLPVVGDSASGY